MTIFWFKLRVLVCMLLGSAYMAHGQGARVLTQNARNTTAAKPIVNIKWYSQQLIYKQGVNIYRRQAGDEAWSRINTTPLRIQQAVPAPLAQKDEDLTAFFEMAKNLSTAESEGFILLSLFVKSFQSPDYARLIGIQYDDTSVEWGKTYEYKVAKVEDKSEVLLTTASPLTVGSYVSAGPVQNFVVELEKGTAKMQWTEEEGRFYGVNVYRSTRVDPAWMKLNSTPVVLSETEGAPEADAKYQDANVQEGMIYYYRIAGLDFFGEETTLSEKITLEVGDLTPPLPPLYPNKKVKVLAVTLSWEIQHTADLAGFHIYRSSKSDGPFYQVTQLLVNKTDSAYVDTVPKPGFYYYYIAAVDEAGNAANSLPILAEVQDVIPPLPPQHVAARSDTGKVIVSWARNTEADIMGYYIFRAIDKDKQHNFVLVNAYPLQDTTYTQKFAKNASNAFLFKVVAIDTAYNRSEPSAVVTARLPDVTPPIMPMIKSARVTGDTIVIAWVANPEPDLAGYNLYRYNVLEEGAIKKVNTDSLVGYMTVSFRDTVRQAGRYFYRLQGVDGSGNQSELSDPFPMEKTDAFRLTFAEISTKYNKRKNSVILAWMTNVQPVGYYVFRKNENDLAWQPISGMVKQASFEDNSVSKKATYTYQIRAYSDEGEVITSRLVYIKTGK